MVMRKLPPETEISACRHYWLCEAAIGPTSKAVCKYCGAVAEFKNWISELEVMHGTTEKALERSSNGGKNAKKTVWQRQMTGFSLVAAAFELNELK